MLRKINHDDFCNTFITGGMSKVPGGKAGFNTEIYHARDGFIGPN